MTRTFVCPAAARASQPCRLDTTDALVSKSPAGVADFIERQEEYIQQLEKESRYCRVSVCPAWSPAVPWGSISSPFEFARAPCREGKVRVYNKHTTVDLEQEITECH